MRIDFDVECSCGNRLSATNVELTITVEPCKKCLEDKENEAYEAGYEDRKKETETNAS